MSVTPQTNISLEGIARVLREQDVFVVCGHISPDGDCIGSTLALVCALRSLGKRACGLVAGEVPRMLRFLPGADELVPAGDFSGACACFVGVDVPNTERLGKAAAIHDRAPLTLCIDHHAYPKRLSTYSYTDPDAVSATLLIWEIAGLLGVQTTDVATACYTGLVTDSGRFQYQNTDARAFEAAAQMVRGGAEPSAICAQLYENDSYAALALESRAFSRLKIDGDLGYALTYLTQRDYDELNASEGDAEGVVNMIRRLGGVRMLCLVREREGAVKLSFRGKGEANVCVIANQFGGGGHISAAGATVEGPIQEVYSQVEAALCKACEASR